MGCAEEPEAVETGHLAATNTLLAEETEGMLERTPGSVDRTQFAVAEAEGLAAGTQLGYKVDVSHVLMQNYMAAGCRQSRTDCESVRGHIAEDCIPLGIEEAADLTGTDIDNLLVQELHPCKVCEEAPAVALQ